MATVAGIYSRAKQQRLQSLAAKSHLLLQEELKKDKQREEWSVARKRLDDIVHTRRFEAACGFIILVNMVLVVIDTDRGAREDAEDIYLVRLAHALLAWYTFELALKFFITRGRFFEEYWNRLDFCIVALDLFLMLLSISTPDMPSFGFLRIFRLIRMARIFKAANYFHELHVIIRSFGCALKTMGWGILMVVLTLIVWAIVAVQLVHPVNQRVMEKNPVVYEGCPRCPQAYASVFQASLTFFQQLVAGDSWGQVSMPIIEEEPWTAIFFLLVLVTISLTLLNLILATMIEAGAQAAADDEHDTATQMHIKASKAESKFIKLCEELDTDRSGSITKAEFQEGFCHNASFRACCESMNVAQDDMDMVFNVCDEDDSGDVDYMEFVTQLRRIKDHGEHIVLNYICDIRSSLHKLCKEVHGMIGIATPEDRDRSPHPQSKELGGISEEQDHITDLDDERKDTRLPTLSARFPTVTTALSNSLHELEDHICDVLTRDRLDRIVQVSEDFVSRLVPTPEDSRDELSQVTVAKMSALLATTVPEIRLSRGGVCGVNVHRHDHHPPEVKLKLPDPFGAAAYPSCSKPQQQNHLRSMSAAVPTRTDDVKSERGSDGEWPHQTTI